MDHLLIMFASNYDSGSKSVVSVRFGIELKEDHREYCTYVLGGHLKYFLFSTQLGKRSNLTSIFLRKHRNIKFLKPGLQQTTKIMVRKHGQKHGHSFDVRLHRFSPSGLGLGDWRKG